MSYHQKIRIANRKKNKYGKSQSYYYGFADKTGTEVWQEAANTDDYLGTNFSVKSEPVYYNEYLTDNGKYRIVIDKKMASRSENMTTYLFTAYDTNFKLCRDYDPSRPYYRGQVVSFTFREHYINDAVDGGEFLKFINAAERIVNNISPEEYVLLGRPSSLGPNYYTNKVNYHLLSLRNVIFQNINPNIANIYNTQPFHPVKYILLDVNYFKTNRKLTLEPDKYKNRDFVWTRTLDFSEYEFIYRFLPMLKEAYLTR